MCVYMYVCVYIYIYIYANVYACVPARLRPMDAWLALFRRMFQTVRSDASQTSHRKQFATIAFEGLRKESTKDRLYRGLLEWS